MARELGDHCYNIPSESIYGEITAGSVIKLVSLLKIVHEKSITIMDIGSGSGYSLVHFAKAFPQNNINLIGLEISKIRAELSKTIIPQIAPKNVSYWQIFETDIFKYSILPEMDICFSFDKTFTKDLMQHIVKLQLKSKIQFVISCHDSNTYLKTEWLEIGKVPCRLRTSGQIITFYIYTSVA